MQCACGSRHWGLHGAAGLLLARRTADGALDAVVLQHRALWSDQGGTWGVPGGAIGPDETAVQGALRESAEEAGIPLAAVRVLGSVVLDHGTWSYTTVLAEALTDLSPAATDAESLEVAWVAADDVAGLSLLPAFGEAWPRLRAMLESTPTPEPHPLAPTPVLDPASVEPTPMLEPAPLEAAPLEPAPLEPAPLEPARRGSDPTTPEAPCT